MDNRKQNLRKGTQALNMQNQGLSPRNTSGARGVTFDRKNGKWKASVKLKGLNYNLGHFDAVEDAAESSAAFRSRHMPFSQECRAPCAHDPPIRPGTAGEHNSQAKLTQTTIDTIKQRAASGESQQSIADDFSVSQAQISRIINRKRWVRVPHPQPHFDTWSIV